MDIGLRGMGWRLRALVGAALLGCMGVFMLARWLADGRHADTTASSLGVLFWMLNGLALLLYLVAMVVLLAKPSARNALFALMALCQGGNLVCMAVESTLPPALPARLPGLDMPLRMAFDVVTVTAIVHAVCLHPTRLPGASWIGLTAWLAAAALLGAAGIGMLGPSWWWWARGSVLLFGVVALGLLSWSYRRVPHPVALVLRRFGVATLALWVLATVAVSMASPLSTLQRHMAQVGSVVWSVFLASVMALVPFLSRSRQVLREFALLAAVSTVATSLDLVFISVFSLGQFASLTLSLFVSIGVYVGARQWLLNQLLGSSVLTTERMFEHLYRIAREVEAHPERTPALLTTLLQELFEPMQWQLVDKPCTNARVLGDGAAMLMPVPQWGAAPRIDHGDGSPAAVSILLRFAHHGRRLFTFEDARLADRIAEQLQRAVAFDRAVEQGRTEERARLAQDLHDDIGARLLTLMYNAPNPEVEAYVRHTLQDLKTLTRGLVASQHRLSHAAAEWKCDLAQRLAAADIALHWHFDTDDDVMLNVVQWSALTRVLRELASNTMAHAQARRLDIAIHLQHGDLALSARDDGIGRNPQAWSHGVGIGGIRKRVKQLGGEVVWRELQPRGIECRVSVDHFVSTA